MNRYLDRQPKPTRGKRERQPGFSMIELDDWILMVNFDDHEAQVGSVERLVVDRWRCGFSVSARMRA